MIHKINKRYKAEGMLKSVLSNRGLGTMERSVHMKSNCTNNVVKSRCMEYRSAGVGK